MSFRTLVRTRHTWGALSFSCDEAGQEEGEGPGRRRKKSDCRRNYQIDLSFQSSNPGQRYVRVQGLHEHNPSVYLGLRHGCECRCLIKGLSILLNVSPHSDLIEHFCTDNTVPVKSIIGRYIKGIVNLNDYKNEPRWVVNGITNIAKGTFVNCILEFHIKLPILRSSVINLAETKQTILLPTTGVDQLCSLFFLHNARSRQSQTKSWRVPL